MRAETADRVLERLARAERIRLFLDYDGALADHAPTLEQVRPDPEVVSLAGRLARHPRIRVAVLSGRRLSQVQTLVPVPGVLLAGTCGVEVKTPEGARFDRLDYNSVRPMLDTLKPRWADLIAGRVGYFLEDRGWALALHARFADEAESGRVLAGARRLAEAATRQAAPDLFRLLEGHKLLEIGPKLAHKGLAVDWLLDQFPWHGSVPLYLGTDDEDEEAFGVIRARGGIAAVVAAEPRETQAALRLESPRAARAWLEGLVG